MAVGIKQLKPGNAYTENNDLFLCISNDQNKQGRLSGKYMVKRKNQHRYPRIKTHIFFRFRKQKKITWDNNWQKHFC